MHAAALPEERERIRRRVKFILETGDVLLIFYGVYGILAPVFIKSAGNAGVVNEKQDSEDRRISYYN